MATAEASITASSEPVFRTVRRGYDPQEVRAYLDRISGQIRDLESRLQQREADLQEARGKGGTAEDASSDPLAPVSAHIGDLLRGFSLDIERLRAKAAAKAEQTEREARVQAQMELIKARIEAERIRTGAERIRTEAHALRSSTLSELRTVRDHLVSSLNELETPLAIGSSEDHVVVLGEAGDLTPESAEGPSASEETPSAATG